MATGKQALLVAYMLPLFQRATGRSGALGGAVFGIWVRIPRFFPPSSMFRAGFDDGSITV